MAMNLLLLDCSSLSPSKKSEVTSKSRYDGIPGKLYVSDYKFIHHLNRHPPNLKVFAQFPSPPKRSMEQFFIDSNGNLQEPREDTLENSKLVSSARLHIRVNGGEISNPNYSSANQTSNYHNMMNSFVSSVKTGSLEPSCEASMYNTNGVWIQPGEFLRADDVNESEFSLADISMLMKKKEKAAVSRFRDNNSKSIFYEK